MAIQSALNHACSSGDITKIGELLDQGIQPDASTWDAAISSGIECVVELMQLSRAAPSVNSLSLACKTRNPRIVELTIKAQARPGSDTLTCAIRTGDLRMIRLIQGLGAKPDVDTLDAAIESRIESVVESVVDGTVDCMQLYKATPTVNSLSLACKTGNHMIVKRVIQAGAHPGPDTMTWAQCTGNDQTIQLVRGMGNKLDQSPFAKWVLSEKVARRLTWFSDNEGKVQTGDLTKVCASEYSIKDRFSYDEVRGESIRVVCSAGAKPDNQTLIDFLVNSQYSYIHGGTELFCDPQVLTALKNVGLYCTGSEQETACILESCLKLDTDCRKEFCQFVIDIGFQPSFEQMQLYFHNQIKSWKSLSEKEGRTQVKVNIDLKVKRAGITFNLLNKAYYDKYGVYLT